MFSGTVPGLEWWRGKGTVVAVLGPAMKDFHIPPLGMRNSVLWDMQVAKRLDG